MATRAETWVVYAAGIAQWIALVTFPAASSVLTDPDEYDLSNTQYGTLFIPQVVTAINARGNLLESVTKPFTSTEDRDTPTEAPAALGPA